MVGPCHPPISVKGSSGYLSHCYLIPILYHHFCIDDLVKYRLLFKNSSIESSMSSWSGDSTGSSISSSSSRSCLFVGSSIVGSQPSRVGGGLIDVPILLSINASNRSRFLFSTMLCFSAIVSGHSDCRGTTFPLALSTNWAISLPSHQAGPRTLPSTSRL